MYVITGTDVRGRRFKLSTTNRMHALGINLFRGSVWFVNKNGKRQLLKRVYNP